MRMSSQTDLERSFIMNYLLILITLLSQPRRMSYSRHAVNEADLGMGTDVNYKMHMQVRRMVSEGRNLRRRKRTQELVSIYKVKIN